MESTSQKTPVILIVKLPVQSASIEKATAALLADVHGAWNEK